MQMRLLTWCGLLVMALTLSTRGSAQELNCVVSVIAPQINNIEQSRFDNLENVVEEFLNGRKWTNDNFEFDERIECSIQITINEAPSQTSFRGSIQIQSSRTIYDSDYKTPVFFANDNEFNFAFLENTLVQFSIDQHRDNLSSVLAYYAYMMIGMDYDSFQMEGGTEFFLKGQTIVANAQNAGEPGWKASQGQKNRFWLVENILSQTFRPLRQCIYNYHRLGFDKLYTDLEGSRKLIADSIIELRNVHKVRPSSYNIQLFFFAKSDEIVNLFRLAPEAEKERLLPILKQLDPGNIQKYENMMS
jgi:hypothetical protein